MIPEQKMVYIVIVSKCEYIVDSVVIMSAMTTFIKAIYIFDVNIIKGNIYMRLVALVTCSHS